MKAGRSHTHQRDDESGTSRWSKPEPIRPDRQLFAERLVRMCEFLPAGEAELVRAVYGRGLSVAELARLLGQRDGHVRARLARIIRRVGSPEFIFSARELERLEPERAAVARTCFLHGLSLRTTSVRLGVSIHRVNMHRRAVQELARSATTATTAPSATAWERDVQKTRTLRREPKGA